MDFEVALYIYADFLLDPSYPKIFSEDSDRKKIAETLYEYFDIALERKGFDFQKFERGGIAEVKQRLPQRYSEQRRACVEFVENKLCVKGKVFQFKDHPMFGKKCEVDSDAFIRILNDLVASIVLPESKENLKSEIDNWGIERFKLGLRQVYRSLGGFFNEGTWVDFVGPPIKSHGGEVEFEHPDSVVFIDQNDPDLLKIKLEAENLVDYLQSANDLGSLTREEASAAVSEVQQLIAGLSGSRVRKRQILELAKNSLGWIAEKGGEAMVALLATSLLVAIAAYFGLPLQ